MKNTNLVLAQTHTKYCLLTIFNDPRFEKKNFEFHFHAGLILLFTVISFWLAFHKVLKKEFSKKYSLWYFPAFGQFVFAQSEECSIIGQRTSLQVQWRENTADGINQQMKGTGSAFKKHCAPRRYHISRSKRQFVLCIPFLFYINLPAWMPKMIYNSWNCELP